MEEYLDIVDGDDKVIGCCTRKEAHSTGKRHRTVMFFVNSPDGKIMVTKRSHEKEFFPGYRSVVMGGHVPSGLSYEDALEKEALEEIGTFGEYSFLGRFSKDIPQEKENVCLFTITVDPKDVRLSEEEFDEGEFITVENMLELVDNSRDFLPETEQVLKLFMENQREKAKKI